MSHRSGGIFRELRGTLRLPQSHASYHVSQSEQLHSANDAGRNGGGHTLLKTANGFNAKLRSSVGLSFRGPKTGTTTSPDSRNNVKCVILMLDDTKHAFEVHKRAKGSALVDVVFEHLGFPSVERDYFGLQFAERTEDADGMRWLDPTKAIRKQFKLNPPYLFYFRVKFYVGDPCALQEETTRYHFFLQIKKDILEGRLVVPQPTAILLASYAVQSDLGDFNPEEHLHGYLADMRLVPNQTEDLEAKIADLHRMHRGQYPSEAEYNFLAHAKRLDMYGVDLHRARVSPVLLRKHLPIPMAPRSPNGNRRNQPPPSRSIPNLSQNFRHNNLHNVNNNRHSLPPSPTNGNADVPRRAHTLSRGAVLYAGQSLRKSFRRLPQIVAQLATGGRMGAYGASMNASDEFIMSKGTDRSQRSNKNDQNSGAERIEDSVEAYGNGVSASELLVPLCMDSKQAEIQLGVTSQGLVVFQNSIKMNVFSWAKIIKISFKKKQFFIQLRREGDEEYDSLLGFNMQTYRSCKNLWQSCVEHHAFFRLQSTASHKAASSRKLFQGGFFHLGSKFRYSGRSAFETQQEAELRQREKLDNLANNISSTMEDISGAGDQWKASPNCQGPSAHQTPTQSSGVASRTPLDAASSTPPPAVSATANNNTSRNSPRNRAPQTLHPLTSHHQLQQHHSTQATSSAAASYHHHTHPRHAATQRPSTHAEETAATTTPAANGHSDSATVATPSHSRSHSQPHRTPLTPSRSHPPPAQHASHHQQQQISPQHQPVKGRGALMCTTAVLSIPQTQQAAGGQAAGAQQIHHGNFGGQAATPGLHPRPCQVRDDPRTSLKPRSAWANENSAANCQPTDTPRHSTGSANNSKCQNTSGATVVSGEETLLESIMKGTTGFAPSAMRGETVRGLRYADEDDFDEPHKDNRTANDGLTQDQVIPVNESQQLQGYSDVGVNKVGVGTTQKDCDSLNNNINNSLLNSSSINNKLHKELHSPTSTVSYLSSPSSESAGPTSLVKIKIRADQQGRYGFNVKGGLDQSNAPIVVSRVAPNTPADTATPRLKEGDEVVAINGREVRGLTHEQVVRLIRSWLDEPPARLGQSPSNEAEVKAERLADSGELILTVRPQAFLLRKGAETDIESEPDFQYIPLNSDDLESPRIVSTSSARLQESMLLLKENLHSGALVAQFEQLYRKNPNMSCDVSKQTRNSTLNRYKDISPYDETRVMLGTDTENANDYINASYVVMKVPTSGIVNRYIATQGPLQNTTLDFWRMVWEQQSTLVVMLTTLIEKCRSKCYKYWPDLYETHTYGKLQVSCVSERETSSFAFREFSLINAEDNEERHISHMQYLAWPDHGVPDDATDFLDFIGRVRSNRDAMVEPTIVHCSAGIGRTGVLILMETAMCLIEANEPVYPLDITKTMRNQRAMLIQTASQYKFVCEAILKVYREGVVKPLPEYQR